MGSSWPFECYWTHNLDLHDGQEQIACPHSLVCDGFPFASTGLGDRDRSGFWSGVAALEFLLLERSSIKLPWRNLGGVILNVG